MIKYCFAEWPDDVDCKMGSMEFKMIYTTENEADTYFSQPNVCIHLLINV